jgi:hypothetical protein
MVCDIAVEECLIVSVCGANHELGRKKIQILSGVDPNVFVPVDARIPPTKYAEWWLVKIGIRGRQKSRDFPVCSSRLPDLTLTAGPLCAAG